MREIENCNIVENRYIKHLKAIGFKSNKLKYIKSKNYFVFSKHLNIKKLSLSIYLCKVNDLIKLKTYKISSLEASYKGIYLCFLTLKLQIDIRKEL